MQQGYIHSIETLGTLDGPGIRMVVFLQGCRLRCSYCHNPDTWNFNKGIMTTAEKIVDKAKRYKPYFKFNDGGVTFSGGEPLMQPEFLLECLKRCKEEEIHTVLDTAGVGRGDYKEILNYTDLVILDIKHSRPEKYKKITGMDIGCYYEFKDALIRNHSDIWIKQVITPGINNCLSEMAEFENEVKTFPHDMVKKVELLPYHTLGVYKYKELNMEYNLEGVEPLSMEKLCELKNCLSIDKLVK